MADRDILKLTCPVCEKNLRVNAALDRFNCLNCGTELLVNRDGEEVRLRPSEASAATMSSAQQRLIEVNSSLKTADDTYGVGCAVASMGITLVACILLSVAVIIQSQILFWVTIALALGTLGFVLFAFIAASSRSTDPLLRQRDELQAVIETEAETGPEPSGPQEDVAAAGRDDEPEARPAGA